MSRLDTYRAQQTHVAASSTCTVSSAQSAEKPVTQKGGLMAHDCVTARPVATK